MKNVLYTGVVDSIHVPVPWGKQINTVTENFHGKFKLVRVASVFLDSGATPVIALPVPSKHAAPSRPMAADMPTLEQVQNKQR